MKGTAGQALAAARIAGCQIPRSLYLPVTVGADARNTYLGHAAQLGLLAAQSALAGFTAPEGVLEELGAKPLAPPGQWLILEGYLKQFAAVRHVHYGAMAALLLREKIRAPEKVHLRIYGEAITYCGNRAPRTPIQAQFSLSYGLAHALLFGSLDPEAYREDRLKDLRLVELEKKVSIEEDPALTAAGRRGAQLEIDGRAATVDQLHEMTREEVLAKFARYARRDGAALLDADRAARFSIPA
jgi:2-methylcitrate dehydratase PrpD